MVNIDETGHKENGKRLMTWVATCAQATVFFHSDSRSHGGALCPAGEDFEGVIGSDFFSAYLKYKRSRTTGSSRSTVGRICIRELLFLEGLTDKTIRTWAAKVLEQVKKLFRAWRRGQCAACRAAQGQIEKLCQRLAQACRDQDVWAGGCLGSTAARTSRFLEDPGLGM